jgi:hypothetical protein
MTEKNIMILHDNDGEPYDVDLDVCNRHAIKALDDLFDLEENSLEGFDFIVCTHSVLRHVLGIMLECGWTEEELTGEVIMAKRDFDDETIH